MDDAPEITEIDRFVWKVPECCEQGWDSCKHVVNRDIKPPRRNPAL